MEERRDEQEPQARKPRINDKRKVGRADTPPSSDANGDLSSEPEAGELHEQLAGSQAQAQAYLEDLQRLKAEFDNYRKRIIKEQTALVEAASQSLVARLLGVVDNFELAVAAAEETRDFDRMLKGVEMVFGELKEVLASEGLRPINAKGQLFDPTLHEAALEIPGDDSGRTVVAEVLRPGYMLKERVLRPAMVKVIQRAADGS